MMSVSVISNKTTDAVHQQNKVSLGWNATQRRGTELRHRRYDSTRGAKMRVSMMISNTDVAVE